MNLTFYSFQIINMHVSYKERAHCGWVQPCSLRELLHVTCAAVILMAESVELSCSVEIVVGQQLSFFRQIQEAALRTLAFFGFRLGWLGVRSAREVEYHVWHSSNVVRGLRLC